jgi:hypothetical protein
MILEKDESVGIPTGPGITLDVVDERFVRFPVAIFAGGEEPSTGETTASSPDSSEVEGPGPTHYPEVPRYVAPMPAQSRPRKLVEHACEEVVTGHRHHEIDGGPEGLGRGQDQVVVQEHFWRSNTLDVEVYVAPSLRIEDEIATGIRLLHRVGI